MVSRRGTRCPARLVAAQRAVLGCALCLAGAANGCGRAGADTASQLAADAPAPQAPPKASAYGDATSQPSAASAPGALGRRTPAPEMTDRVLHNRFAYIPPQCYTATQIGNGRAANPCYVCHARSVAPNYVDDLELQRSLNLPAAAADNPWPNLFAPAIGRAPAIDDAALLAYVRASNYFDDSGRITLAARLAALPAEWDGDGDAHWGGFIPDAWFHFDERGFDHRPDGSLSGWRAFAYYPLPGGFIPSNGSIGDGLIRLDQALRQDAAGESDPQVVELNLAIVEALIARRDVAIDAADETRYGVDLDLDGKLGNAQRVAFDTDSRAPSTRMHYVGRARALEAAGRFPIAPGLFPVGTEFLHTLRYLDLGPDGRVTMAARMKELRYAKKVRWFGYADLQAHAQAETIELQESASGALPVLWEFDRGIYNRQGWLLQGFIEAQNGTLRPQTYEETAFCVGCHGGVGATTDSMFSFARKLPDPARGYFHWTQRDLRGVPEPRRADGAFEYSLYLQQNRAGDEFRDNPELIARFFDARAAPRPERMRELHADIATLLMPSPARALALDRAYRAVVQEQSFARGRDAVLAPSQHVQRRVQVLGSTGIRQPVQTPPQLLERRTH